MKIKKVKVTFELFEREDWTVYVTTNNATVAIVDAFKHYVNEGLSVHDVMNIKTEKSHSYL